MTIPAEIPETGNRNRPSSRYWLAASAIILLGLLLQIGCLNVRLPYQKITDGSDPIFQKVIDDNDLIYSREQRGCGPDPIECFHNPVFLLYYRPLFTATFAVGDIVHPKLTDAVNAVRRALPIGFRGPLMRSDDTLWFHLENMALHGVVCALAFWFFSLLFRRERPALLAGLIFSLHPLQVTVTTFIGGRPDSMALFFLLLFAIGGWNATQNVTATIPALWDERQNAAPAIPALRRFAWLLVSVFAYSCAVFTKEQCISMLLLLPLLLWRRGHTFPLKEVPLLALYMPAVGLYIWFARQIIPFSTVPNPHWSILLHLEMIGRTLWYFERLLLLPTVGPIHQSTLGPWDTPQPGVTALGYLVAVLWLAALWRFRRRPGYVFCALWTTVTLLPCLNLIPIPSQFASCYRAVIPLLGFAGLLGLGVDRLIAWSGRRHLTSVDQSFTHDDSYVTQGTKLHTHEHRSQNTLTALIVLLVVGYYGAETLADVPNWRNNHTLMLAEIDGDPNFAPAYGGLAFWAEGTKDWKEVEHEFDRVISSIMPPAPPTPAFVTAVDSAACQRLLWSHAGLRYRPHPYLQWILPHRGWARQEQGHFSAAIEDYRRALLLNPEDDNTRANLRNCYIANGQSEEAISLYRNAFEVPARSKGSHTTP